MNKKLGADAFAYYWSLGSGRSYQAVANKYGVSKRAVVSAAKAENWQQRTLDMEKKAHDAVEKKMVETLEQMSERHIRVCKLIQGKALEALKSMPLSTAMEAVRALDLAIKQERLIRGEPTDRSAVNIEDVIRREYDRWMVGADGEEEEAGKNAK